ncbi:MAG: peptidase M3A and M3B thimet/oligopeptidase F [Caldiserica bacterium]|nr:MAG: peptidase M3A and M3B thimet/oligopeptidase F [Caldisericota bacterium]
MNIKTFLEEINSNIQRMWEHTAMAYWNLATTGKEEYGKEVEKAEIEMRMYLSDKNRFEIVKKAKSDESLSEVEKREIKLLYDSMLPNQLPEEKIQEAVKKEVEIESLFANFRAKIDGKKVSNNEIDNILKNSTDIGLRKKAWLAGKEIGKEMGPRIIELIKLRNENAKLLGFSNYYDMMMDLQELSTKEIHNMFHKFKEETDSLFADIKDEIDTTLSKKLSSEKPKLMPWHYSDLWFQEAPGVDEFDYDSLLKDKDLVELTKNTYSSMGLDITDILERSDLYERKGKNQHAFTLSVDKAGDVRVLANIRPNISSQETMLHEYGHAIYDKYINRELPFTLRGPAHIFTTEAVAMFFGRMARNGQWYQKLTGINDKTYEEISKKMKRLMRNQLMITARWVMTFVFFEKELYQNPDRKDLNELWYNTVNELQHLNIPNERKGYPDWSAKIHFGIAPVYYHNYLLGEMMASQMRHHITKNISENILSKNVGEFFDEKIFKPGSLYRWNELLTRVTGETLNPVHLANQLKEKI